MMRKSPLLSAAIIITLAAGIGVDVGVFAMIDGALFKPRVEENPDRFVQVTSRSTAADGAVSPSTSLDDYRAYRDDAHAFASLAAWTPVHAAFSRTIVDPAAARVIPVLVSCNFFAVFGTAHPIAGRLFRPDECEGSQPLPVAVIGEDLWRVRLGGVPNVVGSTIALDRRAFTVVGVMPRGFGGHLRTDIWVPLPMASAFFGGRDLMREPATPWLMALSGRLHPAASWDTARVELTAIAARQDQRSPGRTTVLRLSNGSLADSDGFETVAFWIVPLIMGALTLVLLLVCANVTTLMLSRAASRRQEMAIRLSLGGTRRRLIAMLLTESVVFASLAAPIAAAIVYVVPWAIRRQVPTMPVYPFQIDGVVLAYLCGTALLAGLASGLAPALESMKRDVARSLHGYDVPVVRGGWHVRDLLIAAQVALSLVLLTGAGLFVTAELRLANRNAGYEAAQVLLVSPRIRMPPYTRDSSAAFYQSLADRIRRLPAIRGVALASAPPFGASDVEGGSRPGLVVTGSQGTTITFDSVNATTPEYFEVVGIPILRGRAFDPGSAGGAIAPAVITAAAARALAPGREPLGELIRDAAGHVWTVVGVAGEIRSPLSKGGPDLTLYVPRAADAFGDAVAIRFDGDSGPVAAAVRSAIAQLDPDAMNEPRTLASLRDDAAERLWQLVRMILVLAIAALALALLGVYGVVAFAVRVRRRDIGVHIALGATRAAIVRLVVASGLKPVMWGTIAGVTVSRVAASALTRMFRDAPLPLDARDPIVYAGVALLLAIAAVGAMVGPACAAAWSDPVRVLKQE